MKWHLVYSKKIVKQLAKLDKTTARLIISRLNKTFADSLDPHSHLKSLAGPLQGKWRFRVGAYRVLIALEDDTMIVLALEVGHRKDIYKKQ